MSDLTDEMRLLAADGAMRARPMAVTDVIRRGNRRRTRTIAQRSIGGLSAVGLGAAVLVTGVTHHPGSNPAAASGATGGDKTLTVSTSSAAGNLSMAVRYRDLPHGMIKLESVTYSGSSKRALKHPLLFFTLGPGLASGNNIAFVLVTVGLRPGQVHNFSGSLSPKSIKQFAPHGIVHGNDSLGIELESTGVTWPSGQKAASKKAASHKVPDVKANQTPQIGPSATVILNR